MNARSLLVCALVGLLFCSCSSKKGDKTPDTKDVKDTKTDDTDTKDVKDTDKDTKDTATATKDTNTKDKDTDTKDKDTATKDTKDELPPEDKWDASILEKEYGVKMKSVKASSPGSSTVRFLFEFVRDAENPESVRTAFSSSRRGGSRAFEVCLFDDENVLFQKTFLERIDGEITGKKGDAFRAYLMLDRSLTSKMKKVEFRLRKK